MFSNKKCSRCSRKISKEYDFCPYCGADFRGEKRFRKEKDFGMLGKDDFSDFPMLNAGAMPFGFGNILNSLMKELDSQMKEIDRSIAKEPDFEKMREAEKRGKISGSGISISISSSNGKAPEIKVEKFGPEFAGKLKKLTEAKLRKTELTDEQAKKLSKLPRREAETKVRRLSNKLIYELELPGVNDLKNVIITKLENSIEIKAFTQDKAYFKLLPVNLPILDYKLTDDRLIIELAPKS